MIESNIVPTTSKVYKKIEQISELIRNKKAGLCLDFDETMAYLEGHKTVWTPFNQTLLCPDDLILIEEINKKYFRIYKQMALSDFEKWILEVYKVYHKYNNFNNVFKKIASKFKMYFGLNKLLQLFPTGHICIISCGIGEIIEEFIKINLPDYNGVEIYANYLTNIHNSRSKIFPRSKRDALDKFMSEKNIRSENIISIGDNIDIDSGLFLPETLNIYVGNSDPISENIDIFLKDYNYLSLSNIFI